MNVLVLNCGSSSVKYQLFDMSTEKVIVKGLAEKIGEREPMLTHEWGDNRKERRVFAAHDHAEALAAIRDLLVDPSRGGVGDPSEIGAVGHRVVHGGEAFIESQIVTEEVERTIEEFYALAPLHNPPNLHGIRAAKNYFGNVTHVAVFDTAFHQSMPRKAYLYAMRWDTYVVHKIRKYGFHGTSYRYVSQRAAFLMGITPEEFTGVTIHLGNGCSLAAVQNGKSVDTTMGLTPLEGVPMGTRSGDIDPAIIFHMVEGLGMTLEDVNHLLNKESGLKGMSGVSNDLRDVEKAAREGNDRAQAALEVYAYRVRKYIGAYLTVLKKPRALVFCGGVGERGVTMRKRILEDLGHMGIDFDPERNKAVDGIEGEVTTPNSPIKAWVVPTNEELMIARDTLTVAREAQQLNQWGSLRRAKLLHEHIHHPQ